MLQTGCAAPDFTLPNADMELVSLSDYAGKVIVLYFYPKDDSPTCTRQAIEFSDHDHEFSRLGAVVLGVSPDDCISHAAFRDKHGLSIQLLSDVEGEVCLKYGTCQEKETEGGPKLCITRSTIVIDRGGVVRYAIYGTNPKGHVLEVMNLLKSLEPAQ